MMLFSQKEDGQRSVLGPCGFLIWAAQNLEFIILFPMLLLKKYIVLFYCIE